MSPILRMFAGALFLLLLVACGERPLEPRDPTPGVPHFTLMTYNVWNRGEAVETLEAIGRPGADIVCLQETTPTWEERIRDEYADRYPHMLFHSKTGAGGLGLLSRFPLEDLGLRPAPYDWHPAWHVMVETPAGSLQVLNIHLRAMFNGRSSAAEAYLRAGADHLFQIQSFTEECADELPTVIAGDFNEDPQGPAVRYLEERGFRNALPLYRPGQYTFRHPSVADQLTKAIDHILFNGALEPLNAWAATMGRSDHLPVIAHFEAAYDW